MLIVLTSPDKIENESERINQLFAEGLECLHLRKPAWTKPQVEALLKSIDPAHKRKVVLHQCFDLSETYNVKGLHFTETKRKSVELSQLKTYKKILRNKGMSFSSSFHSTEELKNYKNVFDYVFLSPVFDSISKPDYIGSTFNVQGLKLDTKIIALGGIEAGNISKTKEMGFDGAAVLGAIWQKPEMALKTFEQILAAGC